MESDLRLGPFQIIILLLLFLASCDSQQTSEEESDLEGLGTAGVEITPPFSSNTTTESGGTVSFKIRLTSAPLSDVTINLKSDNESEGKVNPETLIFNKDNWDVYVSITVTGQDEQDNSSVADGTQNYSIVVDSIVSNDTKYEALSVNPVQLKNLDNEIADFKVDPSPSWSGNTSENGTLSSSFTGGLVKSTFIILGSSFDLKFERSTLVTLFSATSCVFSSCSIKYYIIKH